MFEAHFQSFDDRSDSGAAAERVAALRMELLVRGLDGFVVPRADRFQNEYVPPSDERLAWLTGFSGSAGMAIVLADRAVLFVDGRYQVQVREEVDGAVFIDRASGRESAAGLDQGQSAGRREARLFALAAHRRRRRAARQSLRAKRAPVSSRSTTIRSTPSGPTGPSRRSARSSLHDMRYAGEEAAEQARARCAREMEKDAADTLMVSDPHAVSWLFNIRGSDVPHTPVVLAFATVPKEGRPTIFVDLRKIGNDDPLAPGRDRRRAAERRIRARSGRARRRSTAPCGSIPAACPEAIARLVTENGGSVLRGRRSRSRR